MSLVIVNESIPLKINADGVAQVGGTRVTLDTVIAVFNEGATPEEIVSQYPALRLADVYTVIGYYLRHQVEVEDYLRQREQLAGEVRRQNEARFDSSGIRDRLLARRVEKEPVNSATTGS